MGAALWLHVGYILQFSLENVKVSSQGQSTMTWVKTVPREAERQGKSYRINDALQTCASGLEGKEA